MGGSGRFRAMMTVGQSPSYTTIHGHTESRHFYEMKKKYSYNIQDPELN